MYVYFVQTSMKQHDEHSEFEVLSGKYLTGEISAEELQILETWVKASEANKKLFQSWKHAWQLAGTNTLQFDIEKAKQDLFEKISTNSTKQHQISPEPTSRKLNLTWRIAAAVLVFVALGFLLITMFGNKDQELIAYNAVLTETLDDGSQITLNQNTTLVYPKTFDKRKREVKLAGDAFFEVARDPKKPFIIEAGGMQVQVLGTSFYVDARPDKKQVEVTVKTGKVALLAPDQSQVVLTAGQKGIFIKNQKTLYTEENTDENFLAWKTRHIQFEDAGLAEVLEVLNRTYGVHLTLQNTKLETCRLTATFDNDSIDDVLIIISKTLDIEINRTANSIILSGPGCE